jgi:exopolyphosphatase/guanosine-5'-triphosphate,3'-diphosphate pyrophosphatase
MVVVRAARALGFAEITVSSWGLREGMVLDAAQCPAPEQPRLTRRASVVDLAQRCSWDDPHSRHVADLATQLFDQTKAAHELDAEYRELLEYGALLHDIGRHIAAEDHHKHAAYLIEHGGLRAFRGEELAAVMTLARFHRNGEPKTSFPPFGALDGNRRAAVRTLVAMLQIADGLDRSHAGVVKGLDVTVTPQLLTIRLAAGREAETERWSATDRSPLLAAVLDRPVKVTLGQVATPASA